MSTRSDRTRATDRRRNRRRWRSDPEWRARRTAIHRKYIATHPEHRARRREYSRAYSAQRRATDPAYKERRRAHDTSYYRRVSGPRRAMQRQMIRNFLAVDARLRPAFRRLVRELGAQTVAQRLAIAQRLYDVWAADISRGQGIGQFPDMPC